MRTLISIEVVRSGLYAEGRCPRHDVLLDPETGCDYCDRECPECDGERVVERYHPAYGSINCFEPYAEDECDACRGTGYRR